MVLLIDNYDSFSYNLVQLAGSLAGDIQVVRNDELTVEDIRNRKPSHLILSPGPGYPKDAGICVEAARSPGRAFPILGVCLGHQAICEAFGGTIGHARELMHGKKSRIHLDTGCPLFAGLPETIEGARYHSLALLPETLPEELIVTARAEDGEIMGVKHRDYPVYGVQFHPESILTPQGAEILKNFLALKP